MKISTGLGIVAMASGLSLTPDKAHSEYRYLSSNPFEIHLRLINDIKTKRLSDSGLTESARSAINGNVALSPNSSKIDDLGPLREICLSFGVKNQESRTLVFRTAHDRGCGDWLVTLNSTSEVVNGVAMASVPLLSDQPLTCGPPGILPPFFPGGQQTISLPNQLKCRKPDALLIKKDTDHLQDACKDFPGLC